MAAVAWGLLVGVATYGLLQLVAHFVPRDPPRGSN